MCFEGFLLEERHNDSGGEIFDTVEDLCSFYMGGKMSVRRAQFGAIGIPGWQLENSSENGLPIALNPR